MTKLALSKVVPGVSYATGQVVDVEHDADSPVTVFEADAVDRAVIVVAVCTEAPTGGYPATFAVGTDDDPAAFIDDAVLSGASAGDTFVGAGLVEAGFAVQVTVTDGDDGAFRVTVLASPTS